MKLNFQGWGLLLWAVSGAPVLFGVYVLWSYRFALSQGFLPFSILPEWLWYAVFGLCTASGVAALNLLTFHRLWVRIATNIIYVPAIIITLLFVHLLVACTNGDCL